MPACFTQDYPIDVQLPLDKFALERPMGLATALVFPELPMDESEASVEVSQGNATVEPVGQLTEEVVTSA